MLKRQFYALEHSNRDNSAPSSSSSSLATASDGSDVKDDAAWPASSHESDASSDEEVVEAEGATSGETTLIRSDNGAEDLAEGSDGDADGDTSDIDPWESQRRRMLSNQWAEAVDEDERERVLEKFKGSSVICVGSNSKVLKCRLCPKVLCLSAESMEAHLLSKGHARASKQLGEGRLKVQLDSDGEEEEEGETHTERYTRTVTTAQEEETVKRKRDSGRQRQRKRMRRKAILETKNRVSEKKLSKARLAAKEVKREALVPAPVERTQIETMRVGKQQKKMPPAPEQKVKAKGPAQKGVSKVHTVVRAPKVKQRGPMATAFSI